MFNLAAKDSVPGFRVQPFAPGFNVQDPAAISSSPASSGIQGQATRGLFGWGGPDFFHGPANAV